MSAFEPHVPAEPKVDMPDFMVVLRGFDRRQVEVWAAEVAKQIEQERLRADEAERNLYRMQIENKGAPSFSHLGTHVASILEEAGRSSENMLADAAERAHETIDVAEEEAAEIIKAAEHRAGEIEQDARRILEDSRAEGARVEEDALQAAEEMRSQAEQDARTVLEEARDATDMIWQEAERERIGVEAETIRLETLRHRSLEQLGRVYGHLESVLDEVRAGIGRVEEEEEDLAEATAAAAARLNVEPPASSPEDSPRFPEIADRESTGLGDGASKAADGLLAATRPADPVDADAADPSADETGATAVAVTPAERSRQASDSRGGSGGAAQSRPSGRSGEDRPEQPARSDAPGGGTAPPAGDDAETTQVTPAAGDAETTQLTPATGGGETAGSAPTADGTQPVPASADADAGEAANGGGPTHDQDATQRLEPVGGKGRQPKSPAKENKPRP